MLGFRRREKRGEDAAAVGPTVSAALIGEGYRRSRVKAVLDGRAEVGAELASDRRAHLLAEIGPDVVVLDCASAGTNPLLALPKLADLGGSPRIIALTDGSASPGLDKGALISLGADATADIRDPRGVIEAVLPADSAPTDPEIPNHRRRTPTGAAA